MKKLLISSIAILLSSCSLLQNGLSESTSDSESISSEETENLNETIIDITNCPVGTGNSYPSAGNYDINGQIIHFSNTMLGSGKIGNTPYIQMRKETGEIKNVTPFSNCKIKTKILVNYDPYVGDMTHELTIKSGHIFGTYPNTLTAKTIYNDETYLYCEYISINSGDQYFSLVNQSKYACYVQEIQFLWW